MDRPSKEETKYLLEGSDVTELGRKFLDGVFDVKPLGPYPTSLRHCLSGAICSVGTQRQVYMNYVPGQLALAYLHESFRSPIRYYLTWVYEGSSIRKVQSAATGVTDHRDRFRPFILAFEKGRVTFRDVYPESHLISEAADDSPIFRLEDGVWMSDIRREAVAYLGIAYEVCSLESFGRCMLANVTGLYRHAVANYQVRDMAACRRTIEHVTEVGFANKNELIDNKLITADDLNHLVATLQLYFPFKTERYFSVHGSAVFRDENAYWAYVGARAALNHGFLEWGDGDIVDQGMPVLFNGQAATIGELHDDGFDIAVGENVIKLDSATAALLIRTKKLVRKPLAPSLLPPMRESEQREAEFRYAVAAGYKLAKWETWHRHHGKDIGTDTVNEWKILKENAEAKGEDPLEALRPAYHRRGASGPYIPETEHILNDIIGHASKDGTTSTYRKMYADYTTQVEKEGYGEGKTISYDKFRHRILRLEPAVRVRIRKGATACYAISDLSPHKGRDIFFDGELHCLIAQADHMNLDINFEHTLYHKPIEKMNLWLSVLVNLSPNFPLAHVITPHRPNAATVHLLMLECIRRNRFLPPFIIVDNESNFDCHALHAVLQYAESSVLWRPPGEPRYGSAIENFFHKVSVQVLRGLVGSYLGVQEFERLCSAKLARNKDLMTIPEFNNHLDVLFYENIYNIKTPQGCTPNEYIQESKTYNGEFHLKPRKITPNLRRFYMPPLSKGGSRKVTRNGTVVGDNIIYADERLRQYAEKKLIVHPDLYSPGSAYIYVPDLAPKPSVDLATEDEASPWIDVSSDFSDVFGCYSYAEVQAAITEVRAWAKDLNLYQSRSDTAIWNLNRFAAEELRKLKGDAERLEKRYRHTEAVLAMNPELRPPAQPQTGKGNLRLVHSGSIDLSGVAADPDKSI